MGREGGDEGTVHHVRQAVDDSTNVLFLAPSMSSDKSGSCLDVFVPPSPTDTRFLAVNYTQSTDRWLETWREHVETMPEDLIVVNVGTSTRSAAATTGTDTGPTDGVIRTVESPEDLTGLGITLGQQLTEWTEKSDAPVVVCFDSLTVLLQYVDLQRTFRFLHVLSGRAASMGVSIHYHLDPTTVDSQTLATLTSLFDATVRREDGEWTARRR